MKLVLKIGRAFLLVFLALFIFSITLSTAQAHCPLCTAATGSVVAITRIYGIDDFVVGSFIGGFLLSTAFWIDRILKKRKGGDSKGYIPLQLPALILLSFVSTLASFILFGLASTSMIFGIDKITAGIGIGGVVTLAAFEIHKTLKKINENKSYFPFQVIVITLGLLAVLNAEFYLLGLI